MLYKTHLFASECDGALYDTRERGWSRRAPLRPVYRRHYPRIETTAQLRAALRYGPFAWPGGYPTYFVTADGAVLSYAAVRDNLREVIGAILSDDRRGGWCVIGAAVAWEELVCEHTGEAICAES